MDSGQDNTEKFWGLIVISAVNIIGVLSDPVPIYTVVQHWILAIDCDCIAIGFSLSLHPCSIHEDESVDSQNRQPLNCNGIDTFMLQRRD